MQKTVKRSSQKGVQMSLKWHRSGTRIWSDPDKLQRRQSCIHLWTRFVPTYFFKQIRSSPTV